MVAQLSPRLPALAAPPSLDLPLDAAAPPPPAEAGAPAGVSAQQGPELIALAGVPAPLVALGVTSAPATGLLAEPLAGSDAGALELLADPTPLALADAAEASPLLERWLILAGAIAALVGLSAFDLGPSRATLARELIGESLWAWVGRPALALAALALVALVWRVALWLRYRPQPALAADDPALPSLTVVIPAYNEGETVYHTIRSLLDSDYPAERLRVICVDDGSRDDTAAWARRAAAAAPDRVTVCSLPENAGKRHALYAGFVQVTTDLVVTVDSDTVLQPDALRALVAPLVHDPGVGAVAGRIDVLNRQRNLLTRMLAVRYRIGFDFSRAYQSELGSVFVTPGAFSCYRVAVVRPHWLAWRDVTFLGARCSNGDDHHLANRVLWQGARTVYQGNAVARTTVPWTYRRLSLMYLRWARSNLRESTLYLKHLPFLVRAPSRWPAVVDALASYLQLPLRMYLLLASWIVVALHPSLALRSVAFALVVALLHTAIFLRSQRSLDAVYTLAYGVFALLTLQWIYPLALLTVRQARWLTR